MFSIVEEASESVCLWEKDTFSNLNIRVKGAELQSIESIVKVLKLFKSCLEILES